MTRFTRRGRSRWIAVGALAAAGALVLAGCGGGGGDNNFGSTTAPQAKGRQGNVYVSPQVPSGPGVTVAADTAYTAYNNDTAANNTVYNLYASLPVLASATVLDNDGTPLINGDMMAGIDEVSTNPQVIRWRMKPGVTWSDGAPWNCKDFYLAYLAGSGKIPGFTAASSNGYGNIGQAQCLDDTTFQATFAQPFADYIGLFSQNNGDLLPAHILEQKTGIPDIRQITPASPPAQLQAMTQFWNTGWNGFDKSVMPASAQYQLDSWVQDQSVTMTRNPAWKGNPGGPERLTYRNIADATAAAQALQNNEIQVTANQPDVNASNLLRSLSAQGVKFQATSGASYEHLDMNFKNPLFADKAVRTAFAQCVPRQDITDKLVKGVQPDAAPLQSLMFLPSQRGYEDAYSQLIGTGNPQQASQTLTQDGWVKGPDGVFAKNGQPLQFRISHTNVPRRVQTVQLIQAACQQAGIKIVDDNDPNFLDTRLGAGDYDVALYAWQNDPFTSSHESIYKTGGSQNYQGYSNPQLDALMAQASGNLDPAGYLAQWQQADKLMAQDLPSIPLYVQPNTVGYTDKIDNVWYQPNLGAMLHANEWAVTQ
ncbi:ABC transporter family substrate-binding protein [Actinomycetospora sp. NBRC 106378]|uniref:ABC transporter family substrate-binding protein n=1 Tax=Actinomycetospora sp. NBRC 106378 TaxID=3032208 RepID=UPI00249FE188|nr:ABC transporter family substrate-binding protein [Actinomycetospora sp. NBRC 106378]GLZ54269.1 peptide ABC transporter substrate-binding protein [Actinomycetospora sp. NBRC 106378]